MWLYILWTARLCGTGFSSHLSNCLEGMRKAQRGAVREGPATIGWSSTLFRLNSPIPPSVVWWAVCSSSFHQPAQCHSSSDRRHSLPQVSLLNHIKLFSLKRYPVLEQSMNDKKSGAAPAVWGTPEESEGAEQLHKVCHKQYNCNVKCKIRSKT